ncbi:MAG: hypothetical protein V3V99_10290 [candidate division Zixibacteria bacterium]
MRKLVLLPADILNIRVRDNIKESKNDVLREHKDVMNAVRQEFNNILYQSHARNDFEIVISEPIKIDTQVNQ